MFRAETWMLTTLFSVGIIAGMVWLNLTQEDPAAKLAEAELQRQQQVNDNSPIDFSTSLTTELGEEDQDFIRTNLQQGDRYLLAGNYQRAIRHYDDFGKTIASGETSILLREAFCYEMLGQYPLASKKYYRSITIAENNNQLVLAISGYTRCLVGEGKQSEALEILADQTLRLGVYANVPSESLAGLYYQYARVIEDIAMFGRDAGREADRPAIDLTAAGTVALASDRPAPEVFLAVIDQPSAPLEQESSPNEIVCRVLQRPGDSAGVISLAIQANLQPVGVLLGQVIGTSGLELRLSPAAQLSLQNRSRTIQLQAVPLSSILDSLSVPFELAWWQTGREIHVVLRKELQAASETQAIGIDSIGPAREFLFDVADRTLRRFELGFQESHWRHAALLSRGNLNLVRQQYDVAANRYQELELARPRGELLARLFFNQAKLQMQLGRYQDAVRLLYLAVDQTVDSDLEASGYCLISSSLLATLDTDSVINAARRGRATAVTAQQTRMSTLNLSRAYLMSDDPFSANDALFRSREAFEVGKDADPEVVRMQSIAALLGAYARFKGVSDERGMQAARNRMLSAIAMIPDQHYQSFVDCYIAAQAYRLLGFANKAEEKMLLALSKPDIGQWQRRVLFELGVIQQKAKRSALANGTFKLLIDQPDAWRLLALQRLAELNLASGDLDACIEACRQLWQSDLSEEQKRSALQLLGSAYQSRGEHHTAALCFAGMLPESF